MTLARRVAEERGVKLGQEVGYQARFVSTLSVNEQSEIFVLLLRKCMQCRKKIFPKPMRQKIPTKCVCLFVCLLFDRFVDHTSSSTHIKFATDGCVLRECLNDINLSKYDVIILDESHERSLQRDILFAMMRKACLKRKDFRVLVTSATLDIEKFSKYFWNCKSFEIEGRAGRAGRTREGVCYRLYSKKVCWFTF